jgi:hypothetical protein
MSEEDRNKDRQDKGNEVRAKASMMDMMRMNIYNAFNRYKSGISSSYGYEFKNSDIPELLRKIVCQFANEHDYGTLQFKYEGEDNDSTLYRKCQVCGFEKGNL